MEERKREKEEKEREKQEKKKLDELARTICPKGLCSKCDYVESPKGSLPKGHKFRVLFPVERYVTFFIAIIMIIITFIIGISLSCINHHNEFPFFVVIFVESKWESLVEVSYDEAAHAYINNHSHSVSSPQNRTE